MPSQTWFTTETDIRLSQNTPYRLLEAVPELSFGDVNANNMMIKCDNNVEEK